MLQMTEKALAKLEKGGSLPELLEAVSVAGEGIQIEGDLAYQRLEAAAERLPLPVAEAARRALLAARRSSRRWQVLSTDSAVTEARISRSLRQVATQLSRRDLGERLEAIHALEREERFPAAPVVATRLQTETDPRARAALARCLGYLGSHSGLPILKRYSRRPEWGVRLGALEGLSYQVGEEAVRLTMDRLGDEDLRVRARAKEVVATRAPSQVVAILRRIPLGRAQAVISEVLPVLGRWCRQPEVVAALKRIATSGVGDLRHRAERLLPRRDAGPPRT